MIHQPSFQCIRIHKFMHMYAIKRKPSPTMLIWIILGNKLERNALPIFGNLSSYSQISKYPSCVQSNKRDIWELTFLRSILCYGCIGKREDISFFQLQLAWQTFWEPWYDTQSFNIITEMLWNTMCFSISPWMPLNFHCFPKCRWSTPKVWLWPRGAIWKIIYFLPFMLNLRNYMINSWAFFLIQLTIYLLK